MTVKEKIVMMVVVVGLVLAVLTFARLSDDALGMLLGVFVGLVVTVPALAALAWFAGRTHAEQRERYDRTQDAVFDLLNQREKYKLLEAMLRREQSMGRGAVRYRPLPPAQPRSRPLYGAPEARRLPPPQVVTPPYDDYEDVYYWDEPADEAEMW
ncbi:MAG: hypothetical protein JXB47_07565 [Anaerolineae bacterium]|nr:hypothetical protein [Anaerolineae bacterium]